MIFTGMQSQDRGSAQVGVLLAGLLGLPAVTTIVGFAYDGSNVTVRRELEGGIKAVVKLQLPAVLTCQLGPQHAALSDSAEHHEGQEERTALPAGRRPAQGRSPDGHGRNAASRKRRAVDWFSKGMSAN